MTAHVLRWYRCKRPVLLHGRVLSTGERVRLPPVEGAELVESGHLVELEQINGDSRQWTQPEVR